MSKKLSNKVIGFDLGTTNSCAAIDGKVISNKEGKNTTPSVVFFNEKGEKEAVGKVAKGQAVFKPKQVVFEVKRLIGRSFNSKDDLKEIEEFRKVAPFQIVPAKNGDAWVKIGNKEYAPAQVSAFVLQEMKEIAENYLEEVIKKVVITVPAYFNDAQRQATKDAGEIAGLEVVRIINEPTAAALAYGIDKNKALQTIAVFDLGGGTFDISIIEIREGNFKVKAVNGDTFLGGANFDQKIIDWLIREFESEPGNEGIDLRKDPVALQRLKEAAENAKHDLSFLDSVEISLNFIASNSSGPKHINKKKLTRQKLEEITKDLLEKLVLPCKNCLKDAKVNKVDEVILVGGMTRMVGVQKKIKEIFGKEANKSVNPDEAVAVGASIQGAVLAGDTTKDILLLDVTPLSLGIVTEKDMFARMIPRNTTIPADKTEIFSTAVDNQPSVSIDVRQGEREKASANKQLGFFELSGIEPAPRGVPQIEVKFDIDSNGIVKVSAKDRKTGKEANITITNSQGLSPEEKERMIREAEEKRAEDEEFKENAQTLSRAQSYCSTFEKQIEEFKNHKDFKEDDPQFQEFKKLHDNLKEATKAAEEANEEEKKEKYSELKKQIGKVEELMKLAQELMKKMPQEEKKEGENEDTMDVQPEKKDEDKK